MITTITEWRRAKSVNEGFFDFLRKQKPAPEDARLTNTTKDVFGNEHPTDQNGLDADGNRMWHDFPIRNVAADKVHAAFTKMMDSNPEEKNDGTWATDIMDAWNEMIAQLAKAHNTSPSNGTLQQIGYYALMDGLMHKYNAYRGKSHKKPFKVRTPGTDPKREVDFIMNLVSDIVITMHDHSKNAGKNNSANGIQEGTDKAAAGLVLQKRQIRSELNAIVSKYKKTMPPEEIYDAVHETAEILKNLF